MNRSPLNMSSSGADQEDQTKALYSKLKSLVPHQREVTSSADQLEEATKYIQKLQRNVEKMKRKKESLLGVEGMEGVGSPRIEIRVIEETLEIVLITGLECQTIFNESIRILHDEGAEILNASFSTVKDFVFHTIHAQVGGCGSTCSVARITERLKNLF